MTKENSKKSFTLDFPSFSESNKNLSQFDPKRIESTSTIDSDGLKKQIRSYMSSGSIFDFKKTAIKPNWLSGNQLEPIRKISALSDNALNVKNIKPFIPKSYRYSSSNLKSYQQESIPLLGQSYSSACLPVMCMSYYPVGTVSEKLTGELKFFDETQNYGFFMLDSTGEDLFVHYDDLTKSGISKECIRAAKEMNMKFKFRCISYYGRYNLSYKAVDIHLLTGLEGINQGIVH